MKNRTMGSDTGLPHPSSCAAVLCLSLALLGGSLAATDGASVPDTLGYVRLLALDAVTDEEVWPIFFLGVRGPHGYFESDYPFSRYPSGRYAQTLSAPGYVDTVVSFDVAAGETTALKYTLVPQQQPDDSHGVVRVYFSDPLFGGAVRNLETGAPHGVAGSMNREWSAARVRSGLCRLTAHARNHHSDSVDFELTPGTVLRIHMGLKPRTYIQHEDMEWGISVHDDSILRWLEELDPMPLDREYYRTDPDAYPRNSRLRLQAWRVFNGEKGRVTLKRPDITVEGDRIYRYLIVESGHAMVAYDYTRDEFGGCPRGEDGVTLREVLDLNLVARVPSGEGSTVSVPYSDSLPPTTRLLFFYRVNPDGAPWPF